MAKTATRNAERRIRVQVGLPADLYEEFKERADEQLQSESSFGAALIRKALQTTTTEARVNSTQATA